MKSTPACLSLCSVITASSCRRMLGMLVGAGALSLIWGRAAIATDVTREGANLKNISTQQIENLQSSGALNGILCSPDCGRFFEEGRDRFEAEVQQLVESRGRLAENEPVLQVDPSLPNLPASSNFLNSPTSPKRQKLS